jgi:hypothetical protein
MDREQAVEALELLRRVVGQARDDTTLQNWGVIWMLHAVTNGVGFVATNVLIWRGYESPWAYVLLWAVIIPINLGSIFVLKAHPAGAWTFFESMIWLVWLSFIGAVLVTTASNLLSGFQILQLGPATAVLSAYAFAMMGGMMGKRWFLGAGVFALAALLMGVFPRWQFVILGAAWALVQAVAGAILHAQRRRRLALGAQPRLV